ncbi:MAG: CubicO group peptidase (beta-lactamase class C family) [Crocinitomix sp.]|jgi:CubicO group peptidase (beta-lactamase class C family)
MKNQLKIAALSLFLIVGLMSCKKEINNSKDFEKYLEDEIESQNIPALSALIFKGESILFEGHYGQANIESGISLESTHPFLMASVSKTITATALLQLYEDGLFGLDDPINDYLSFTVNGPGETTPITFKMLLTHTSGIADGPALDGQYYYGSDSPVALDYFLENYLVPGGEFYSATENYHDVEPGTESEYSNVGNALIGVLVEQISGIGFNAYCKANIFTPMGMSHTTWRLDEALGTVVMPYNYSGGEYEAIGHYTFTDYPNGGLRSTTNDMFKFLSAFAQNGSYGGVELLQATTVNAVTSLQIPTIDDETGLHFFIMNKDNDLWGHDGGEQGVATIMAFNKSTKVGAIILCNQGEANLDKVLEEAYLLGLKL